MQALILGIWISQGILMFFDEFIYHHKRGLGKWERIGHPVDTIFFLAPFLYTQFYHNVNTFIGLCILSCLIVTKDEFVHSEECDAKEQWLHSLLFVIHPLAFGGLWLAWQNSLNELIQIQLGLISLFLFYQVIYWNYIADKKTLNITKKKNNQKLSNNKTREMAQ